MTCCAHAMATSQENGPRREYDGGMEERRGGDGRHFERARGLTSVAGRSYSGGYARFGGLASAARMAFDELTIESFIRVTQCAPHTLSRRICRRRQSSVFP